MQSARPLNVGIGTRWGQCSKGRERRHLYPPTKSMSTIEDVRAAEKSVQRILDALRKASALDPGHLGDERRKATAEYATLVRGLESK